MGNDLDRVELLIQLVRVPIFMPTNFAYGLKFILPHRVPENDRRDDLSVGGRASDYFCSRIFTFPDFAAHGGLIARSPVFENAVTCTPPCNSTDVEPREIVHVLLFSRETSIARNQNGDCLSRLS